MFPHAPHDLSNLENKQKIKKPFYILDDVDNTANHGFLCVSLQNKSGLPYPDPPSHLH